jgi:hypothetical protein
MSDPVNDKVRFFRTSDRLFRMNGEWFFASREGDLGPYQTRDCAEREAELYVERAIALGHAPLTVVSA